MMDIIPLFHCFDQCIDQTTRRQLRVVVAAMLAMTGRVTMLGLSRWAEKGGSYRTVQRLYNTVLPWGQLFWLFFRAHVYRAGESYLLVGDECVVTKAGQKTHGLGRFFSSLYKRVVPGLSFFTLSLVSIKAGQSYPLLMEQVMPADKPARAGETEPEAPEQAVAQRKVGRPKGSKNKDKTVIEWTDELRRLARMGQEVLGWIGTLFPVTYVVLDGHFGHNNVLQVVRQSLGLHLISKLRHDSALYFQYDGPQKKYGPRRRYGAKINYQAIPAAYLVESTVAKKIRTEIYQATMLHKCFAQPLNVVIIVKTNLQTGARAHVVLFSSDLALSWEQLIRYYRLRFQIEFNFRDAKQFWGLEDFMNVNPVPVTNAANLALFMVLVSQRLLQDFRRVYPLAGILDLKTFFHGRRYALATLELLPQQPAPNLIQRIILQVARLGAIHPAPDPFLSP